MVRHRSQKTEEDDEAFHTTIEFGNEPLLYDGKDVIEVAFYIGADEITESPMAVRETILQMVRGHPTYNASMARKRKLEIKEHQCSWEETRTGVRQALRVQLLARQQGSRPACGEGHRQEPRDPMSLGSDLQEIGR